MEERPRVDRARVLSAGSTRNPRTSNFELTVRAVKRNTRDKILARREDFGRSPGRFRAFANGAFANGSAQTKTDANLASVMTA